MINVLMTNRANSYKVLGGDTIQMGQTSKALIEQGINVTIRTSDQLSDDEIRKYDLIHIFNIQTFNESREIAKRVSIIDLPWVISPIYWDPLPQSFALYAGPKRIWRTLLKLVGYKLGYWVYRKWRQVHYPFSYGWQSQYWLLSSASAILPNSLVELKILEQDYPLFNKNKNAFIVPNAIDTDLFNPEMGEMKSLVWKEKLGIKDYILEVGRISPEKNCLALIEALWNIPLSIVFVGQATPFDDNYVQVCRQRAMERGNVFFIDRVEQDELPGLYSLAAVHVLPSWRETPGLANLEAAAVGCRIVSTCIGSAYEYFGNNATYCHPRNLSSIRESILSSLDKPKTDHLSEYVRHYFTWEIAAEKTKKAYSSVLA